MFTSEEYNEYSQTPFNNVFGFFVNGVNYALLPDAITPVSINNVNGGNPATCFGGFDEDADGLIDLADPDCTTPNDNIVGEDNSNSAFYINNDCSDLDGGPACPIDIEGDGLTVVLTVTAPVRPNDSTNHIRLGIADAGDSLFDSWVLLEAGSFEALDPELCAEGGGPNLINEDGDEFTDEGCFVEGEDFGSGQFTTGDNSASYEFNFSSFGSPLNATLDITEATVLTDHDLRFFAVLQDPRDIKARLATKPNGPFYVTTNCVPLKPDTSGELAMCVEYIGAKGPGGLGDPPPQPGEDFTGNITWVNNFSTNLRGPNGGPPFFAYAAGHDRDDVLGDQFTEDILDHITIDNDEGVEVSDSFTGMVTLFTSNIIEEATGPTGAMVAWNPMFTPDLSTDTNDLPEPVECESASGLASGDTFPLGITQVNCTGIYDTGPASGFFHVTVVDTTAPTLGALPADQTLEATGPAGAVATFALPTSTDLVDTSVAVSCAPADGSTFPLGMTEVMCTATDGFNQASDSFNITVEDTTPPTIGDNPDLVVPATSPSGAVVTFAEPAASDTVDPAVDVECVAGSGSVFPIGQNTAVCTATDDSGNTAQSDFSVTVTSNLCVLYDQTKNHKSGSTVPIKLRLCTADGTNLSSPSTVLHATGLSLTGSPTTALVEDSGQANPDDNFRYDAGLQGYIFNLSTKGLASGTWTLTFTVGGVSYTVNFGVK